MQTDTDRPVPEDGKRARAKAANRDAILSAARDVFARIGYDAASVRDIIRETSLASGTFYNYFRSKEEVFEALTDDSVQRFRPSLEKVRRTAKNFHDYVEAAYTAYFRFLADEMKRNHGAGGLPQIRTDTPGQQAIFEEIRADIKAAHTRGELRDTDIGFFTAACIGMARDVGERMMKRRPIDPDAAARFCCDAVLGMIGKPD